MGEPTGMDRRDFLKLGLAGTTAVVVSPAGSTAAAERVEPSPGTELTPLQPLEAYTDRWSVRAGGTIGFHASVLDASGSSPVTLRVYHQHQLRFRPRGPDVAVGAMHLVDGGLRDHRGHIAVRSGQRPLHTTTFAAAHRSTPASAARRGCGWPRSASWMVPAGTPSGVYLALLTRGTATTWVLFVVRPASRAPRTRVLYQLAVHTYQAYNFWGGESFYAGAHTTAPTVSFDRPCQLWDYIEFESQAVRWFDAADTPIDFCTNADLERDPHLLDGYQLFISSGHDEYWSTTMRNRLAGWVEAGGNALFLTANACYRPVCFDTSGTRMSRATQPGVFWTNWAQAGRPESDTIGANWSAGRWEAAIAHRGFVVRRPDHWLFEGTSLAELDTFGADAAVIGYETDAVAWEDQEGWPLTLGTGGTPTDFAILATALLPEWVDEPGLPKTATIGWFRRGRGIVFDVGTTAWSRALAVDPTVQRMTANLLRRLKKPEVLEGGTFYAVTAAGDLRVYRDRNRDGTGDLQELGVIGHGGWGGLSHMAADGLGAIYAITPAGDLTFHRDVTQDGTGDVGTGATIGTGWGNIIHLVAGGGGTLYATTTAGDLVFARDTTQDGTGTVTARTTIGHGGWGGVTRLIGGGDGVLYALTGAGDLRIYRDVAHDGTGDIGSGSTIGHGGWGTFLDLFSLGAGTLYAVTADGRLVFFRDRTTDGTGEVLRPQTVGRSDWQTLVRVFGGPA